MVNKLDNKVYHFRLDNRDPNEAEVRRIIEENKAAGKELRQLVTECLLACHDMKPVRATPTDKLLRQLRFEIQRFGELLDKSQFVGYAPQPDEYEQQEQPETRGKQDRLSKDILRNISSLISEATEYEDE